MDSLTKDLLVEDKTVAAVIQALPSIFHDTFVKNFHDTFVKKEDVVDTGNSEDNSDDIMETGNSEDNTAFPVHAIAGQKLDMNCNDEIEDDETVFLFDDILGVAITEERDISRLDEAPTEEKYVSQNVIKDADDEDPEDGIQIDEFTELGEKWD